MSRSGTSQELHQLLHSLSQAEKRYFKVFAQSSGKGGKPNTVSLFDAILKQKTYDEEALKAIFRGEKWIRHLSSEKVYLQQLVMRSLRAFHSAKSPDRRLKDMLFDSVLLREKGLYGLSQKVVAKAKVKARSLERWTILLELLEMERMLIKEITSKGQAGLLKVNLEERMEALEALHRDQEFARLYDRLFLQVRSNYRLRSQETMTALSRMLEDPLLRDEQEAKSFQSRLYYHSSHALFQQLMGKFSEANEHYQAVVEVWADYPTEIQLQSGRYLRSLGNYLSSCHLVGKLDRFPAMLTRLRDFPAASLRLQVEQFKTEAYYELLYRMGRGEFEAAEKNVPSIQAGLERYGAQINLSRTLGFHYNLFILFFFLESYSKALYWLNLILNEARTEQRRDIQQVARILQLIIHYELGNVELLGSLFRSTYRYLTKRQQIHGFEKYVLDCMRKIEGLDHPKQLANAFRDLQVKLSPMREQIGQNQIPGLDELVFWLESKLEGRPLREIAAERLQETRGQS